MSTLANIRHHGWWWLRATLILLGTCALVEAQQPSAPAPPALAQPPAGPAVASIAIPSHPSIIHKIRAQSEQIEMTVNTSRILVLDQKIPQIHVDNPELLDLHPLSPNEVQISAKAAGVTHINLWGEDHRIFTIDVIVFGDAQALATTLKILYPTAAIKVVPLSTGVILSGYVDQPEQVTRIVEIAKEYYPRVINSMQVSGVQQVALHVKLMEVSRTKLRTLGFDFAKFTNGNVAFASQISGLLTPGSSTAGGASSLPLQVAGQATAQFNIFSGEASAFLGVLEAMRQDSLLKVLAEPTITTVSGRPAMFLVGGQVPVLTPQSLGTVTTSYMDYGTQVDFVPIVLGNGRIRLEVRTQVSAIDPTAGIVMAGINVPGFRSRKVETGTEMMAGQTLAVAGLVQEQIEATNQSVPLLGDMPYIGAAFRSVSHTRNEIEMLVVVTPELVSAVNTADFPPGGPGSSTRVPNDKELYLDGHLEVPICPQGPMAGIPAQPAPEILPAPLPSATQSTGGVQQQAAANGPQSLPLSPGQQISNTSAGRTGLNNDEPGFIGPVGFDVK